MGLLPEIEAAATDPTMSEADLLRKCKVLAYRLGNGPFKEWVDHELSGYPLGVALPEYRKDRRGRVVAEVAGSFGRSMSNVPVPISLLPDGRKWNVMDFRQGVAELRAVVANTKQAGKNSVINGFPPEVFASLEVVEGFSTMAMQLNISLATVEGILDQIRTRALTFALELESADPSALETGQSSLGERQVTAIFNNVILGGNVNLAQGNAGSVNQAVLGVVEGDLESLMARLDDLGIAEEERRELREAIEADEGERPPDGLGERTKQWLGGLVERAAASGGRITEAGIAAIAATAIARYLGIA